MAPINTNNVLIRLQEQSVGERSFLEASFVDYGEVARLNEERVDDVANPILEKFVNNLGPEGIGTLTNFTAGGFRHFPYALYAVDVKSQPSLRPTVRFAEQKHYLSGKHHLYGYKIEAAVSPDERCVAMSNAHPGFVHDLTFLHTRREPHTTNLTKSACEAALPDHGELSAEYMTTWACLVDMGFIGVNHTLRGIHPKRSPQTGFLDAADVERNLRVSSDHVVVENFFGRVYSFWKVSYATFTWGEKIYGVIQRTTFALTNFHLSLIPARAEAEDYYALVMVRYQGMAN
ncbi:hypothetical protein H257_08866 [Aphanomyces astaci]|uniref:DDE Tnp4 domain-containing protein n=1 Tax=Aphanomyces astaci TaxID=112090 RepID=W4GEE7_APHAT|nr:hypothetical protein H257_08866 [Aphanomyces astaci]ETV77449.1 hypothetical protein H257_08866 [Aphanomyces astaci]|eukprot:XP_009833236.1 hypothetical protein H257_08866 [Aphanomyces astaci]